jgi:hypothetical protein
MKEYSRTYSVPLSLRDIQGDYKKIDEILKNKGYEMTNQVVFFRVGTQIESVGEFTIGPDDHCHPTLRITAHTQRKAGKDLAAFLAKLNKI